MPSTVIPEREAVENGGPSWGNLVLPASSFDVNKNLWERVASESPANGAVSWADANETVVFDVDFAFDYDATMTILGYAYTDFSDDNYGRLRRQNPLRHPRKPWLCASGINTTYYGPRGKQLSNPETLYPTQPEYTSEYKIARMSVMFKPLAFDLLEDSQVTADTEWNRNVEYMGSPSAEFITREGGANWQFVTDPVAGVSLPTIPFAISESKVTYEWTWHYIPEDFVCSIRGEPPDKWSQALNQVNNATAFGIYPRWTMLQQPFSYVRRPMVGMSQNGVQLFYLDIKSHWLYFNPSLTSAADTTAGYFGHNLAPAGADGWNYHFFTGPLNVSPLAIQSRVGRSDGRKRYEEYDFSKLFKFVSA